MQSNERLKMCISKQHHDETSTALQRCKSFTFDINQQAQSLGQWEQRYNQHSGGVFNGYLDELKVAGLHFFEEFTNQTLQQQCCVKADNLWLGFSLQPQRPKINNNEILAGQIMTRSSGIEFELITPEDFHIYGLVLNKKNLSNEMFGIDAQHCFNRSNEIEVFQANHYVTYELAKLIALLLASKNIGNAESQILENKGITRLNTLMPLILSRVADLLAQTEYSSQENSVTYQTKQRVISAIKNYIKQDNQAPLTITELCKITQVSRRTLQYCFQQGFGLSPIQYIRNCRLNEIRRILLKVKNNMSIADLVLNFGFFHIGTFNHQYKDLFGETPTQTKQRSEHYQQTILC